MISCASITGYRDVIEDGNLRFAVVPGHEAGKDESSVHKLARMLSAYYGRADYSRCLRRKHNMAKLSTGGSRSLLKQYQSMEVDARYTVSGKKFLLLDDIVTTGNSMMAARKRLLEAGAAEVYPLAMAQTVLEPETPFSNKETRYNPVNMDDTLSSGTNSTGRWFSISTKMVVNGRLKEVITWNYTKFQTDMWRYQTSTMDQSHDTVVSPGDKVFAYGMNRLGWPYEVREFWGY